MATTEQNAGTPSLRGLAWAGRPASESDLARGMILLRASNMNVMRLQLAMERRDRRLAMEALDGLVALDGELKEFVEDMPPSDRALGEMARRLDDQKAVLASEKLIFAAGRSGPALALKNETAAAPLAPVAEPEAGRRLDRSPEGATIEPGPDWIPAYLLEEDVRTPRARRFAAIAAVFVLLILGTATALYWFGVDTLGLADTLPRIWEAL